MGLIKNWKSNQLQKDNIQDHINYLKSANSIELRRIYIEYFGKDGFLDVKRPDDLFRQRIAHFIQSKFCSQLSAKHHNQIKRLSSNEKKNFKDKYQLKVGTILTRKWKGHEHNVLVVEKDKFEYNNNIYNSLSAIAKIITGHERSGPSFFGLK